MNSNKFELSNRGRKKKLSNLPVQETENKTKIKNIHIYFIFKKISSQ